MRNQSEPPKSSRQESPAARRRKQRRLVASSLVLSLGIIFWAAPKFWKSLENSFSGFVAKKFVLSEVTWHPTETLGPEYEGLIDEAKLLKASELTMGTPIFSIDLKALEQRLKLVRWIDSLQIQKRLPGGLAIEYSVHRPRAIGVRGGALWYIGPEGRWIEKLSTEKTGSGGRWDLPVFSSGDVAIQLLTLSQVEVFLGDEITSVHEIRVDAHAARVLIGVKYSSREHKVWIVLSKNGDSEIDENLTRVRKTLQYLIKNNILVHSVDARFGKKVVVNLGKDS